MCSNLAASISYNRKIALAISMSKDNSRGLGSLSDDQLEILYRQTQDGMRKKGLPSKRRVKGGGYSNYTDEDHSRARTIDKDFYRGKGSFQYNDSPKGQLEKAFGVKKDPEKDPSLLFDQAFGDKYKRKNLSGEDIANMMIDVKDERYKRRNPKEEAASAPGPAPETDNSLAIESPRYSPEISQAKERVSQYESETDLNKQGPLFDESTTADTPAKDPQAFADQYKLNLINTGATKQPNDQTPKLVLN